MASKWKIYKASGKVAYFVDDIMAPSKEDALKIVHDSIEDQVSFAASQGNIEVFNLKVEPLRPATKEEVIDGYGEEAWED